MKNVRVLQLVCLVLSVSVGSCELMRAASLTTKCSNDDSPKPKPCCGGLTCPYEGGICCSGATTCCPSGSQCIDTEEGQPQKCTSTSTNGPKVHIIGEENETPETRRIRNKLDEIKREIPKPSIEDAAESVGQWIKQVRDRAFDNGKKSEIQEQKEYKSGVGCTCADPPPCCSGIEPSYRPSCCPPVPECQCNGNQLLLSPTPVQTPILPVNTLQPTAGQPASAPLQDQDSTINQSLQQKKSQPKEAVQPPQPPQQQNPCAQSGQPQASNGVSCNSPQSLDNQNGKVDEKQFEVKDSEEEKTSNVEKWERRMRRRHHAYWRGKRRNVPKHIKKAVNIDEKDRNGDQEEFGTSTPKKAAHPHTKKHEWGYDDQGRDWDYPRCKLGTKQSPINIRDKDLVVSDGSRNRNDYVSMRASMSILHEYEKKCSMLEWLNNGHTVQITGDFGSVVSSCSEKYNVKQFHFHSPSEHTLNGKHYYDMEMHIVHQKEGATGKEGLLVVGVFFDVDPHHPEDNKFLSSINWNALPIDEGTKSLKSCVDLNLLDNTIKGDYFAYEGSLTTPTCDETATWRVMQEPQHMSRKQLNKIQNLYSENEDFANGNGNNRVTQPLNGRIIVSFVKGSQTVEQTCSAAGLELAKKGSKDSHVSHSEHEWSYGNLGEDWGGTCQTGKAQSPIDIKDEGVEVIFNSPKDSQVSKKRANYNLEYFYGKHCGVQMTNNGHALQVNGKFGYISSGCSSKYKVLQFHFHSPSEHTFNGKHYDMEMHIVHQKIGAQGKEGLMVVAVFFDVENYLSEDNEFLRTLGWNELPKQEKETVNLKECVDLNLLKDSFNGDFYAYEGSLTTPGCDETVSWRVMKRVQKFSKRQLLAITSLFEGNEDFAGGHGNNRLTQNWNGRTPLEMRRAGQSPQEICIQGGMEPSKGLPSHEDYDKVNLQDGKAVSGKITIGSGDVKIRSSAESTVKTGEGETHSIYVDNGNHRTNVILKIKSDGKTATVGSKTGDDEDARENLLSAANQEISEEQKREQLEKEKRFKAQRQYCVGRITKGEEKWRTGIFPDVSKKGCVIKGNGVVPDPFEPYLAFWAFTDKIDNTVPYCVMSSRTLWRTQIVPNKSECGDKSGSWEQEFVFYAYPKLEKGTLPVCIRESKAVDRAVRQYLKPDLECASKYWKEIGTFFVLGEPLDSPPPLANQQQQQQASDDNNSKNDSNSNVTPIVSSQNNSPEVQSLLDVLKPAYQHRTVNLANGIHQELWLDLSGHSNHALIRNGARFTTFRALDVSTDSKAKAVIRSHGNSLIPDITVNGGLFTIDAWVNPTEFPKDQSGGGFIFAKPGLWYLEMANNGSVRVYCYGTNPAGYHYSAHPLPLNQHSHVLYTYDGSSHNIYVNGNLDMRVAASGSPATVGQHVPSLGAYKDGSYKFYGKIFRARYYNNFAFSSSMVSALFKLEKPCTESGGEKWESQNGVCKEEIREYIAPWLTSDSQLFTPTAWFWGDTYDSGKGLWRGNVFDVKQESANLRPFYLAANRGLNGYPTLQFHKSATLKSLDDIKASNLFQKYSVTIYVVQKNTEGPTSSSTTLNWDQTESGSTPKSVLRVRATNDGKTIFVHGDPSGGRVVSKDGEDVNWYGKWHILAFRRNDRTGEITEDRGKVYRKETLTNGGANVDGQRPFDIGREFAGEIAEIIIFREALPDNMHVKIQDYLACKYNIAGGCKPNQGYSFRSKNKEEIMEVNDEDNVINRVSSAEDQDKEDAAHVAGDMSDFKGIGDEYNDNIADSEGEQEQNEIVNMPLKGLRESDDDDKPRFTSESLQSDIDDGDDLKSETQEKKPLTGEEILQHKISQSEKDKNWWSNTMGRFFGY